MFKFIGKAIKYTIAGAFVIALLSMILIGTDDDQPVSKTDKSETKQESRLKAVDIAASKMSLEKLRSDQNYLIDTRQELWDDAEKASEEESARLHEEADKLTKEIQIYSKHIVKKKNESVSNVPSNIKSQFSSWDGSHRLLVKMVKNAMNDPDSFDHDKTTYHRLPDDAGIQVSMIYRGKNAFGGVVRESITARFTLDGKFIQFVE